MRIAFPAAVSLLVLSAAPITASATPAATDGPCTSGGVTVVVDATKFSDGHVSRKCVTSSPSTAYQALEDAGVNPEHGTGQGQSGPYDYLCRIESRPTKADDPCTGFVANKPYWAFWVPDDADAQWAYAQEGVDTYAPVDGETIGFSFGVGDDTDPNQMSLTLAQAKDPSWSGN